MRTVAVYRGFTIRCDFVHAWVGRSWFFTVQQAKDAIDRHWSAKAA